MIQAKIENHRTLEISQEHFLTIAIESFLVDRKAAGLAGSTVEFYTYRLQRFTDYCESQAVQYIQEINADFLRQYLLALAETHNPGGVHGNFRALRVFLRWIEAEEIMPPEWKNPIHRVKPPRVDIPPIDPVPLEDVQKLLDCCIQGDYAERDRVVFLFLLDTGVRAGELCNLNWDDLDFSSGVALIRQSKGRRPRIVCFGRKNRRALNRYHRTRKDHSSVLFASKTGDRLTYAGLREIIRRRARDAGLTETPSPHDFRRAFALQMLRNGSDIFALQRLMGHSDLSVLRRYLAQSDQDIQAATCAPAPLIIAYNITAIAAEVASPIFLCATS